MNHDSSLIDKIRKLKAERGAVILAHNYQLAEVQDIADFLGDSLELSRRAAATGAEVIVFCGVHFMAETAKILSPDKTVLIPDIKAGCPMADMINAAQLIEFKKQYPGRPVVAYVNTSAAVKAESTICCTSANALRVAESIDADEILFVPDKSLAEYVASKTTKRIIPFPGFCPTHHRILAKDVMRAMEEHPEALVLAHPECTAEVIALADSVESTSGMLRYAAASPAKEFIICTERGLIHGLAKRNPGKAFYSPSAANICPNMKKITLEKVLWSLEDMKYAIELDPETIEKARGAIERMIAL